MNPPGVSNDPLHGRTLEQILTELQKLHGWEGLALRIKVRCFIYNPTLKSSLKFLRHTPWARKAVEELYLKDVVGPTGKESSPS